MKNIHPDDSLYVLTMLAAACVGVFIALLGCYTLLTGGDTGLATVLSLAGLLLAGIGLGEFVNDGEK